MAASSSAVAAIWASAAAVVQAIMAALSSGTGSRVAPSTSVRNSSEKGRPNRKRTCVAPTVPSVAVSSFCMALRSTWPPDAKTVKTTHNHGIAVSLPERPALNPGRE